MYIGEPILAIDPGNEQSAWALWDGTTVLDHGKAPNAEVLARLRRAPFWGDFCARRGLAVEMVASYGMAVGKEVFETCLWVGRFVEAWARSELYLPARLVYRREVKLHLCESPKANDANIRAALIDRFGGKAAAVGLKASPGPLYGIKADRWAALAVAITAAETLVPFPPPPTVANGSSVAGPSGSVP